MLFVAYETKSSKPNGLVVRCLTYRKFDAMELRVCCDGTFRAYLEFIPPSFRKRGIKNAFRINSIQFLIHGNLLLFCHVGCLFPVGKIHPIMTDSFVVGSERKAVSVMERSTTLSKHSTAQYMRPFGSAQGDRMIWDSPRKPASALPAETVPAAVPSAAEGEPHPASLGFPLQCDADAGVRRTVHLHRVGLERHGSRSIHRHCQPLAALGQL